MPDPRDIRAGHVIPSEGYCDQPYIVVNSDGSWTCLMTTGKGHEGDRGQHVVACRSPDQGQTWGALTDIEPSDGPEASWVMPLRVPETGRIYAFYTYNRDNHREVKTVSGGSFKRVDSFGVYAYRFSDDFGVSWSATRYEIPMRLFQCDRDNVYGGERMFFWGVGKPFLHRGRACVCYSKVGGFGRGFFEQNEGAMLVSPNLLTEPDPVKHEWQTLPAGDVGLRTPPGGGPIAGEFNVTPLSDGTLYGTYRTIDGWPCHAYSTDDGNSWTREYMTYTPGGRRVKNPRAANFVRRFSNGKYLYWYHNHGGRQLGETPGVNEGIGYLHRNPVWLSGGTEIDGRLHWSQPEIILFDRDDPFTRMSYPDFIEQDGDIFVSETQKTTARVHQLAPELLAGLWQQDTTAAVCQRDLALVCTGSSAAAMPALPKLVGGGGFSVELAIAALPDTGMLLDAGDAQGRGIAICCHTGGTVELQLHGLVHQRCGRASVSWDTDPGLLTPGAAHHIVFIIDGSARIISVVVDGQLSDGGEARQHGWCWLHPWLDDVNGAEQVQLSAALTRLRLYTRALRTSEAIGNWRAGDN